MATLPPPGTVFYGPPSGVKLPAELRAMMDNLDRLYADQVALQAEAARLRDQRPAVELRDREAVGDAERAIAERQAEFDEAVKRLERARAALARVGGFARWAAASPEAAPGVTVTLILSPACEKAVGRPVAFESILGWLRDDAAGLAAHAPKPRTRLRLRRVVRRGDRVVAVSDNPNTDWGV